MRTSMREAVAGLQRPGIRRTPDVGCDDNERYCKISATRGAPEPVHHEADLTARDADAFTVKRIDTLRASPRAGQRDERRMPPRQNRNSR